VLWSVGRLGLWDVTSVGRFMMSRSVMEHYMMGRYVVYVVYASPRHNITVPVS
jgi:hypothetical protein